MVPVAAAELRVQLRTASSVQPLSPVLVLCFGNSATNHKSKTCTEAHLLTRSLGARADDGIDVNEVPNARKRRLLRLGGFVNDMLCMRASALCCCSTPCVRIREELWKTTILDLNHCRSDSTAKFRAPCSRGCCVRSLCSPQLVVLHCSIHSNRRLAYSMLTT